MADVRAPRGTRDLLPPESGSWEYLESVARQTFLRYGYGEVRTPIFEATELFARGVGEATDIVQKEMYTFTDRAGRSLTLRPEGTAPVVRAFLEHGAAAGPLPWKVWYLGPMFRYERPQAGRQRQFTQLGAEALGSSDPRLDAEIIALAVDLFTSLGLRGMEVRLNSIGDPVCRPRYLAALQQALAERRDALCPSCQGRLARNPLRVLDCKEPGCQSVLADVPPFTDHLCGPCAEHHRQVRESLDFLGLGYVEAPRLVRGLDYYTRTVFEVVATGLGAQDAVGGGGRYDGLAEALGGPPTPGVGFAAGVDRLLLALERQGVPLPQTPRPAVFVAGVGAGTTEAWRQALRLRRAGLAAECDYMGRSLKAQVKHGNRLGARFVVVVGDEELATGRVRVKEMASGEEEQVALADLESYLRSRLAGLARRETA